MMAASDSFDVTQLIAREDRCGQPHRLRYMSVFEEFSVEYGGHQAPYSHHWPMLATPNDVAELIRLTLAATDTYVADEISKFREKNDPLAAQFMANFARWTRTYFSGLLNETNRLTTPDIISKRVRGFRKSR